MKLSELYRIVNNLWNDDMPEHRDQDVMVAITLPYQTIGSIPMEPVKSANSGFDWENGKFILRTEQPLTYEQKEFAENMKKLQEKLGWAEYEKNGLQAEVKRLKKLLNQQFDDFK